MIIRTINLASYFICIQISCNKKVYLDTLMDVPSFCEKNKINNESIIIINTKCFVNMKEKNNNYSQKQSMKNTMTYQKYYETVDKMNENTTYAFFDKNISNMLINLSKKYSIYILHRGPFQKYLQDLLSVFNTNNSETVLEVDGYKNPILKGNIIYTFFKQDPLVIFLFFLYVLKQKNIKKIYYITYFRRNNDENFSLYFHEDVEVISVYVHY